MLEGVYTYICVCKLAGRSAQEKLCTRHWEQYIFSGTCQTEQTGYYIGRKEPEAAIHHQVPRRSSLRMRHLPLCLLHIVQPPLNCHLKKETSLPAPPSPSFQTTLATNEPRKINTRTTYARGTASIFLLWERGSALQKKIIRKKSMKNVAKNSFENCLILYKRF